MRQNPAGFPFRCIRVHMRRNSLCKGNLVSSMICLDTKISRVTLETCIFTRLSLRPHSFIVDEQRFRLVSAEERQNHDRQECELKGARPALGFKCHCREHKLRPRSGSVKIFWGGVQQCCWADSFWQSVTDETDLCHQRSAFCPAIGFFGDKSRNPSITRSTDSDRLLTMSPNVTLSFSSGRPARQFTECIKKDWTDFGQSQKQNNNPLQLH